MSCTYLSSNPDPEYSLICDVETVLHASSSDTEIGQRLGINYMRSQQEEIYIDIGRNGVKICLQQSGMGLMAISSVVWDAGLLLVDFLCTLYGSDSNERSNIRIRKNNLQILLFQQWKNYTLNSRNAGELGHVLELGSGTGIGGLACVHLGATSVTFSDISQASLLKSNIEPLLQSHPQCHIDFLLYNWENSFSNVPANLIQPAVKDAWDTVICSDVLYESKLHACFMQLLKSIRFNKMILGFKIRNDVPEKKFIVELSTWCDLAFIDNNEIDLVNLPNVKSLSGQFVIIAVPKYLI